MLAFIGSILISIAVLFVTVFLFVGWLLAAIIRGTVGLIAPKRPRQLLRSMQERLNPKLGAIRCSRDNCRNFNPPTARFCRCCGANLIAASIGEPVRGPMRNRMTA